MYTKYIYIRVSIDFSFDYYSYIIHFSCININLNWRKLITRKLINSYFTERKHPRNNIYIYIYTRQGHPMAYILCDIICTRRSAENENSISPAEFVQFFFFYLLRIINLRYPDIFYSCIHGLNNVKYVSTYNFIYYFLILK